MKTNKLNHTDTKFLNGSVGQTKLCFQVIVKLTLMWLEWAFTTCIIKCIYLFIEILDTLSLANTGVFNNLKLKKYI